MRYLLDTCTFLWIASDSPDLSPRCRDLVSDRANDVFLSPVSGWEIAVKHRLGRLPLPEPPGRLVPELREKHEILSLPLDEESALTVARLPDLHRDPFDRMLVSQAIVHGLALLTPDRLLGRYPVRTVW